LIETVASKKTNGAAFGPVFFSACLEAAENRYSLQIAGAQGLLGMD